MVNHGIQVMNNYGVRVRETSSRAGWTIETWTPGIYLKTHHPRKENAIDVCAECLEDFLDMKSDKAKNVAIAMITKVIDTKQPVERTTT